jgi:hypothetical protein
VLEVVVDDQDRLDPPLLVGVEKASEALDGVLALVAERAEDGEHPPLLEIVAAIGWTLDQSGLAEELVGIFAEGTGERLEHVHARLLAAATLQVA